MVLIILLNGMLILMNLSYLFRGIFKSLYAIKIFINSIYYNCKLSLFWKIGNKVIFEGKLYIPSYGGEVIIGSFSRIGPDVRISSAKGAIIKIGENVSVNQGTFIVANGNISIGNNSRIGEYVSIRDNDHGWQDPNKLICDQGFVSQDTYIGNDVWIGRGAVISKGIQIGDGSVIGANAVVTKNVEPYTVNVGAPSKKIKKRDGA